MAGFFARLFGKPAAAPAAVRAAARQQVQQQAERIMTPERQELLRRAMEIQSAKQKIFDALSDEKKQELVAMTMRKALNERPAAAPPKRPR
jgi:hypothetical protein